MYWRTDMLWLNSVKLLLGLLGIDVIAWLRGVKQ
jgi:hypothetical protein